MYYYRAFELYIKSEFELPRLMAVDMSHYDVNVYRCKVPLKKVMKSQQYQSRIRVLNGELFLDIPGVAKFCVKNGSSIGVDVYPNADMQTVKLYVLGSCLGAIIHQRGLLILHANAIKIEKHAIAIAGNSGMGKSTLAATFMKMGYKILSDDLVVIDSQNNVTPSYPQVKLWQDSAERLNLNVAEMERIRIHQDKFEYPIGDAFCDEKVPIDALFILNRSSESSFRFESLRGRDKYIAIYNQIYRKTYLRNTTEHKLAASACLALCVKLKVFNFTFSPHHHPPEYCAEKILGSFYS